MRWYDILYCLISQCSNIVGQTHRLMGQSKHNQMTVKYIWKHGLWQEDITNQYVKDEITIKLEKNEEGGWGVHWIHSNFGKKKSKPKDNAIVFWQVMIAGHDKQKFRLMTHKKCWWTCEER